MILPDYAPTTLEPLDRNRNPDGSYKVGYKRPPVHSRFKPGQSGNPGGRPKGRQSMSRILERLCAMTPEEFEAFKPKTVAEEMAKAWCERAVDPSLPSGLSLLYSKALVDRMEGKPGQAVDVCHRCSHLDLPDPE